jgi:hypothetical protein
MTDAEKLVEWFASFGDDHLPLCESRFARDECSCGLTEARELAARVVERLGRVEAQLLDANTAIYTTQIWMDLEEERATLRARVEEQDKLIAEYRGDGYTGEPTDEGETDRMIEPAATEGEG